MNLIGVESTLCPGQKRVVAGDPATRVLVHSVQHTPFGSCIAPPMPNGRPMLSQAKVDLIRAWIVQGATNN